MITPIFRFPSCLLFIVLYLFVFSSCKQKTDYSKEISRLDSASAVISNAEKILYSVDTASLRSVYNSTQNNLHSIMEKISKDTVKKKTALFLSDAYEESGNILNLLSNRKFMEKAINGSKKQIDDLKHDLNENLIEKNKSAAYVVTEITASGKISDAVNKAIEKAKSSALKLDSLKTRITFLADSLRN